jgi:hypothetical protein
LLTVTAGGQVVANGWSALWPVEDLRPITCRADLVAGVANPDDPALRRTWRLYSASGALLEEIDRPYNDPAVSTYDIDHAGPDRMALPGFTVYVRVYRQDQGTTSELGACNFKVQVKDRFDRQHPYVRWRHLAIFFVPAPTVDDPHRQRTVFDKRRSAIHRTAIPGRCSMLGKASGKIDKPASPSHEIEYFDELPFPVDQLNQHRDVLCEYCFYGGPDKTTSLI